MKVLMINVSCGTGSTGRICTELASSLEKAGNEVKIAYGRDLVKPAHQKYAVKIGSDTEVKMHVLYARLLDASGLGSKHGTKKFLKWVREYDPDIIHLHNIHGYYIHVPMLFDYLKECNKPIIWTLHDCWAFTGHTAFCDAIDCRKWMTGCEKCPMRNEYPSSLTDFSKRNWKWKKEKFGHVPNLNLVTPSRWLADLAGKSFLSEYEVNVIHNGIDPTVFRRLEKEDSRYHRITDKKIVLGVTSVWNQMKGLDDFIRLSEKLDDHTAIVLVGLTKEQIRLLPPNMIGIERTGSPEELNELYNSADVFVNLTYCDNYPTTNLEARACGKPIITYDTGGSPESAGKDAIVVPKGDLDRVVTEINRILNRGEEPTFSGEKVQSAEDVTNEYLELYNRKSNG